MIEAVRERRAVGDAVEEIEEQVRLLLGAREPRARAHGPRFAHLWDIASECLLGGKLLRPRLLIGAFDALAAGPAAEASRRRSALRISAAVELLHFSFLLHDDVIDEDLIRRGAPNAIGRLLGGTGAESPAASEARRSEGRRLHWARSNAILLGDLMLAAVHQVFAREAVPEAMRVRLLDLLDRTITESVAGEQHDIGLSDGVIASDLDEVLEMSRLKTATYTFELPLRAAAILAGADARLEEELGAIARHLGVAFQLQDDLLCAFGDSREHGKDPFSDFREGKETAIIAYARTTSAWSRIDPKLGAGDFGDEDGRALRSLLRECGAERAIRSMVDERIRAAVGIVCQEEPAIPRALMRFLLGVVEALDGRRG
ncbi:polyprenyl synthetase family protein [Leucobacter sp. CSA1]|uniref:Polyprenyl synthetase family protein n=1 Tax=Leucobacter chromiisoli TaxID=2796471 RepID=A0A934Q7X2_9MICO|nr:polyprenyl synthetase family protein [Leucobacter chromiisoli]MBK0419426.1 polyprenyl synthetase family protein [Leucobacter chromiisoli]